MEINRNTNFFFKKSKKEPQMSKKSKYGSITKLWLKLESREKKLFRSNLSHFKLRS